MAKKILEFKPALTFLMLCDILII